MGSIQLETSLFSDEATSATSHMWERINEETKKHKMDGWTVGCRTSENSMAGKTT